MQKEKGKKRWRGGKKRRESNKRTRGNKGREGKEAHLACMFIKDAGCNVIALVYHNTNTHRILNCSCKSSDLIL